MAEERIGRLPLFQQVAPLTGLRSEPAPRAPRRRRRGCWICTDRGLPQELVAAPGGGWKCGRGHGAVE